MSLPGYISNELNNNPISFDEVKLYKAMVVSVMDYGSEV